MRNGDHDLDYEKRKENRWHSASMGGTARIDFRLYKHIHYIWPKHSTHLGLFLSFGQLWKALHPPNIVPSRISNCLHDLFGCAFPEARLHQAT